MGRINLRAVARTSPLILLLAAAAPKPIDLPGDRLFPESVSITPDGTAYVSSMNGGVVRVSLKSGKAETWIKPGAYGNGSLFGVLADTRNRMLWVCTNDFSARGVTVPGADRGHLLKGFDLKTGIGKVSLALPGEKPVCNDMAVAKDGSLLIADTGAPQVLRWEPGARALDIWVTDPILESPKGGGLDGIAFGGDGNLYLNNVRSGDLYRVMVGVDGKAGAVTKLILSRPLISPDGMRPIGGMDFALAEGAGRIDRVTISGDRAEIKTLAEGVASPTGVDVNGKTLWYVQGQLSFLFDPSKQGQSPGTFRLTPINLAD
jgi:sugar lactone lactonase YvrE